MSAATILHVDMDAFFAAIEQRDHPEFRGKPVIVGAPPDRRGVVSTASYEARVFGVHSAMPSRTAARLCPHGVFLPVRGERYQEVSGLLMALFREFTPLVEPVSIDEAFLDVSGALRLWPDPVTLAREMKQRIRERLQLTASVGVAPNKFLAKLASELHKPDGLTVVPESAAEIEAFLAPLPVRRIWGVGPATEEILGRVGIRTIGQIQHLAESDLARLLGPAAARHVRELAFGRDSRSVNPETEEKSLSAETTFDEDCADVAVVRQTLVELTERVGRRLRACGREAGTGHIKLRFSDFRTITRQRALRPPSRSDRQLLQCALELFAAETGQGPIRLVGFGVSNLTTPAEATGEPIQPSLFPTGEETQAAAQAEGELDRAVDALRERYGEQILRRGSWRPPAARD